MVSAFRSSVLSTQQPHELAHELAHELSGFGMEEEMLKPAPIGLSI